MPNFGKQSKQLFLGSGGDPGNCCPRLKETRETVVLG
jgi:hypothetical protein